MGSHGADGVAVNRPIVFFNNYRIILLLSISPSNGDLYQRVCVCTGVSERGFRAYARIKVRLIGVYKGVGVCEWGRGAGMHWK